MPKRSNVTEDDVAEVKLPSGRVIKDCAGDGCEKCDVCKWLSFLEYFECVAPPGSSRDRDVELERYIDKKYPA